MSDHRTLRILWRALTLRCVVCGGRPVLLSWFRESPSCPVCGFRLDRSEPGYWLGSYNVNLGVTLLVVTVAIVVAIAVEWPSPHWQAITVGAVITAVVLPVVLFPFTKTLYLALDVLFRPPEEAEFRLPEEPALNRRVRRSARRPSR